MNQNQQQQQTYDKSRLKMKRRLASDLLKCGKKRIWMDPSKLEEIAFANNRRAIQRLIDDEIIIRKPQKIKSRFRAKRRAEERKRGRHSGPGCVRGTKNSRHNRKKNWMRRVRILRRMLHKCRETGKISKSLHRKLYLQVKGGNFKTKKALMEEIFKMKDDEKRQQKILSEIELKRKKAVEHRERKRERDLKRTQKRISESQQAGEMMKKAMREAQSQQEEKEKMDIDGEEEGEE